MVSGPFAKNSSIVASFEMENWRFHDFDLSIDSKAINQSKSAYTKRDGTIVQTTQKRMNNNGMTRKFFRSRLLKGILELFPLRKTQSTRFQKLILVWRKFMEKYQGAKIRWKTSKSSGTDRQKFGYTTLVGFCVFCIENTEKRKILQW